MEFGKFYIAEIYFNSNNPIPRYIVKCVHVFDDGSFIIRILSGVEDEYNVNSRDLSYFSVIEEIML